MTYNPLNFPPSTIVAQKVPKNAFYKRAKPRQATALQSFLTHTFDSIEWLYKLHSSTLNIADGKLVREIDVFECQLKDANYDVKLWCELDALLPRQTIFLMTYKGKTDILIQYKKSEAGIIKATGQVERLTNVDLSATPLPIVGYDMDRIYTGFLGQVSQYGTHSESDYLKVSELTRQREILQRQCDALMKKKKQERQYNLRLEIGRELKRRQAELSSLSQEIETIKCKIQ